MTKRELRREYMQKRKHFSDEEYATLNHRLRENFFKTTDLSAVSVLHTFLPIDKNREVDTWAFIRELQIAHPHVRIAVPKMNNQTSELEHYYFEHKDQLAVNTWGIPEPVSGIPVETSAIDLVLVPLLAFDSQGHRVGYGRGFYDRFLATCRTECSKIGISYFDPVARIDDVHENDIALDRIITPSGVVSPQR